MDACMATTHLYIHRACLPGPKGRPGSQSEGQGRTRDSGLRAPLILVATSDEIVVCTLQLGVMCVSKRGLVEPIALPIVVNVNIHIHRYRMHMPSASLVLRGTVPSTWRCRRMFLPPGK